MSSLRDQLISVIATDVDGGSLYNHTNPQGGAKKAKRKRKTKAQKKAEEEAEAEGKVLFAGCSSCGLACSACNNRTPRAAQSAAAQAAPVKAGRRKAMSVADKAKRSAGAKASPWIQHVKAYAKEHGVTYGQALKEAAKTYKKGE